MQKPSFPKPSALALEHSQKLQQRLATRIQQAPISFADYMHSALYEPGLGYYAAGSHKLGTAGDFITAPMISALFSQCLAKQCMEILPLLSKPQLLEFGAGTGQMALDILRYLHTLDALPDCYYILEVSADLAARQEELFAEQAPELLPYVQWLSTMPENFSGVILANEVLDAMPVELFRMAATVEQAMVQVTHDGFNLSWQPATQAVAEAVSALPELAGGYQSELNLALAPWLTMLDQHLADGVCLFIDYGFPAREYYHPDRHQGTLMCHYRHLAHTDPFYLPGLTDITAHVDFTAVAQAATDLGWSLVGYTNQANFLLNLGLLQLQSPELSEQAALTQAKAIQKLIMPQEMGELFKVIAFEKQVDVTMQGFASGDQSRRL